MTSSEINCLTFVNRTNSYCLNEDSAHPHTSLFEFDGGFGQSASLQSDTDEQLLLSLSFNQTVKLTSIQFNTLTDGTAPCIVKLFSNRP
jgi:hypothetical protein